MEINLILELRGKATEAGYIVVDKYMLLWPEKQTQIVLFHIVKIRFCCTRSMQTGMCCVGMMKRSLPLLFRCGIRK